MSTYLVDKFLFTVDRDPEWVERYLAEPEVFVPWWEQTQANRLLGSHAGEDSTWLVLEPAERQALIAHDHVALFGMGAHPFLTLTLFIALFERSASAPLEYQIAYGQALAGFSLPHPDIST